MFTIKVDWENVEVLQTKSVILLDPSGANSPSA